jgi:NADH-quinone oxidoreductase subunit F
MPAYVAPATGRRAARDSKARRILGENVFSSGQRIRCEVLEGAGAFVCGEETAMIASIDGMRGMPAPKPPFPEVSGLRALLNRHFGQRDRS